MICFYKVSPRLALKDACDESMKMMAKKAMTLNCLAGLYLLSLLVLVPRSLHEAGGCNAKQGLLIKPLELIFL